MQQENFFLKEYRVKVTLRFRGREMAHMASSKHVLDDFAEHLADVAVVEKAPKIEGRSMTMFSAKSVKQLSQTVVFWLRVLR